MTLTGFDRRDLRMMQSLFRMTLADRFLGSSLGLAWAILSPLLLMGIFAFVFSVVFPGRIPGRESSLAFVIWLLSGYGPWLAISEGLMTGTNSVVSNSGIVKNVAFKPELLPIVGALIGVLPLGVAMAVILVLHAIAGEAPGWAWLALPVVIALHMTFIAGLGLFLGALNVFMRDTALALPNVLLVLLFASPIFYPMSAYPAWLRPFLQYNPFYVIAECFRAPVVDGKLPPLWMIAYLTAVAAAVFLAGLWWFRRLKTFFDSRL